MLGDRVALYTDYTTVKPFLASLLPVIEGKDAYITATGMFNKIAMPALPLDNNGKVLGDVSKIHTLISPTEIPDVKTRNTSMNLTAKMSSYREASTMVPKHIR